MRPLVLAVLLLTAPARLLAHEWPEVAGNGSRFSTNGPEEDERAVLAVVQRLFDAMQAKDTAGVRSVFEPGARLVGMRIRPDGAVVLQQLSVDEFVGFIGRDTRGPWIERAFNPEVRIRGTLATVWAQYDFHFAKQFSHCGVDAIQLLRLGEGWKVVSLADTFEREGCPRRAVP